MGNPTIEMVRTSAHSPIHVPKRGSFGCVLSGWLRLFLDRIPQALLAATYRACPEMTLSKLSAIIPGDRQIARGQGSLSV